MSRRMAAGFAGLLALSAACGGDTSGTSGIPAPTAGAGTTAGGEVEEGRALLQSGRLDEALARVQDSRAPEAITLQGDVWAKKAETAPLPTPEALPPGSPRGAVPVTPEFKPEEQRAIALYEKAIAAIPGDPRPHTGLAKILAPHAQRRYDREQASAAAAAGKRSPRGRTPVPTPPPPGPDFSPARVAREFRAAASASSADADAIEALYAFATRTRQIADAEWALQERLRRENENPDHLLRYGDFLRDVKKDPEAAIEQYRQVLIWRADDPVAKSRIGEIYMDKGNAHYESHEYAVAEARYKDAEKWIVDRSSPQYQRLQREMDRLKRLRQQ